MKAFVNTRYGSPDVLQLKEIEKPVPKDNEILVNIRATSINQYDLHYITGTPLLIRLKFSGMIRPKHKILGADIAGQVETAGKNLTRFKKYGYDGSGY